jgi:DNA-directed RNA polymerase subunit RPC12/RpoP
MREIRLKCYRCGKENDVIDMRYTAANRMICKNCMEKSKNPQAAQKDSVKIFEGEKDAKSQKKEPQVEYQCKNCRYSFKRKESASVSVCPYCSAEGELEIKDKSPVDRLIKESIGEDYDM